MRSILTILLTTYMILAVVGHSNGEPLPIPASASKLKIKGLHRYEENISYSFTYPGNGYQYLGTGTNATWEGQVTLTVHNYSTSPQVVDFLIHGQNHIISIDNVVGGRYFNWFDTDLRFNPINSNGEYMDAGAEASITFTVRINYPTVEGWTGVDMMAPNTHMMNSTDDIIYFIK